MTPIVTGLIPVIHLLITFPLKPLRILLWLAHPIFATMLANSTFPKWRCKEGTCVFPTRGPDQPHRPGMAILFRCMQLNPANAIFRNIFLSPSAAVRPHIHCFFILSKGPVRNVPRATVGQVRCKIQISAKPGCAYGLQLMTAPPWFPIEVVVVMSLVLPTHLDPSVFCGVLVMVATGLPTRWGPNVHAAASVSGILSVGLVGLFASIVLSYVCRRRGSTVSCLPSVSAGATCRLPVVGAGQAASRCQHSASGIGR